MTDLVPPSNEEGWAALEHWGEERRMNELEALMWRGERHPEFSSVGIILELLDAVPDWERFRRAHEWGVAMVPRFRKRVVEPALPIQPPVWAVDPDFDLDYHLRRVRLPPPAGMRELLDLAQKMGQTPLDRKRPLWVGTLVEGLEGGRAAYVLQVHHCLMDGLAGTQLFAGLHSKQREPSPNKPIPEPPAPEEPAPLALAVEAFAERARRAPRQAVRTLEATRRALASPADTLEFIGSLRRVLSAPPGGSTSPLLGRQTGRTWRYGVLECGLDELKAAGRAAGGSVNDAYIAALLGGIRRYHLHLGIELGDIPVAMPVSTRRPDDGVSGNRFAGAFFVGPSGTDDPAERIAAIRGAVLSVREEPALDYVGALSPILSRAPSALLGLAISAAAPRAALSASNFPGIPYPVYAAGAQVERMFVFGPLPGLSMLATLWSYNGTCCIGINCDGAVYEDTDLLWTCLGEGLDEVLDLGRRARGAPRARANTRARRKPVSQRSGPGS